MLPSSAFILRYLTGKNSPLLAPSQLQVQADLGFTMVIAMSTAVFSVHSSTPKQAIQAVQECRAKCVKKGELPVQPSLAKWHLPGRQKQHGQIELAG